MPGRVSQPAACGETEATRLAHASYYLELAEDAVPRLLSGERDAWLDRLAVEHDNLRAVLAWSQEDAASLTANEERTPDRRWSSGPAGTTDIGLRLASALTWFWILRCHFSEGAAGSMARCSALPRSGPTAAYAKVLYGAGMLAMHQGDYAAAAPRLDQALAMTLESAIADALSNAAGLASYRAEQQS